MTAGAVLCGGASRRMGTDKALVEVAGVAMAERVARALDAGGCRPVAFVGGDLDRLAAFGRPVHPDRFPGAGPLGGVVTALGEADDDVVVAACDLPFLDGATVEQLLAATAGEAVDVVVAVTDRPQPALAWWSAAVLDVLERLWADGVRSLHGAVAALRSRKVPVAPDAVRNVNAPPDLP